MIKNRTKFDFNNAISTAVKDDIILHKYVFFGGLEEGKKQWSFQSLIHVTFVFLHYVNKSIIIKHW